MSRKFLRIPYKGKVMSYDMIIEMLDNDLEAGDFVASTVKEWVREGITVDTILARVREDSYFMSPNAKVTLPPKRDMKFIKAELKEFNRLGDKEAKLRASSTYMKPCGADELWAKEQLNRRAT